MKKKITIIDYGLGNVLSAKQSFLKVVNDNRLNFEVIISNRPMDILTSSHIVLPGQGAFKSCMSGLKEITGMISVLEKCVLIEKKPFLGICVGMQLLAEKSYENGEHSGLGLNIAKNIVELHKGAIAASNRIDQKGAQIEVLLPKI